MAKYRSYPIEINVDDVLRGQGADPEVIRSRNNKLVIIADQALEEAKILLKPKVWKKTFKILSVGHKKIVLENGVSIKNSILVKQLMAAEFVTAIVCTVGSEIDQLVVDTIEKNVVLAFAIDGVGSAGVESLANTICASMEADSLIVGQKTTIPLSPGMIGWPINEGQPLIFDLLSEEKVEVELTEYFLMKPRKTLSMLIGQGKNISSNAKLCDYCQMNQTCKYKNHYQNEIE